MLGTLISFDKKMNADGTQNSFNSRHGTFYPHVVVIEINKQMYQGEANTTEPNAWWALNTVYEIEIKPHEKKAGGNAIKISKPKEQEVAPPVNQSPAYIPPTTPNPVYPATPLTSPVPPNPVIAPNPNYPDILAGNNTPLPGTSPYQNQQPVKKSVIDTLKSMSNPVKEFLIISEVSFKVASEYIASLNPEDKAVLMKSIDAKEQVVSTYADHIFNQIIELVEKKING
jgi:hypothetical protein